MDQGKNDFFTEPVMAIKTNMVKNCLKKELQEAILEREPDEIS